jgi:CRP-like cAMP-binding protein
MTQSNPELLTGLSAEDAANVMALGEHMQLPPGAELFTIGAAADHLFLVERGRINLTLPLQLEGNVENLLVEERGPGEMLGWSALFPPHRFTLRAVTPLQTELIAFSREALLDCFARNPQVAYVVTRNVAIVIGHRLQMLQAMWLREVQRALQRRLPSVPA